MFKGKAPVAVCAALIGLPTSVAEANSLFFGGWEGSDTSLRRLDLESAQLTTLVAGSATNTGRLPHNFGPEGIAVDPVRGHLYYCDTDGHKIARMNFDGSGQVDLVAGLGIPEDIALDLAGKKMYWTDTSTDKIQRANLDGSGVQDLVTTGLLNATGIALDVPHGRMYWSDYHRDVIGSATLLGGSVTVFSTPGGGADDIVVDPFNQKLIWSDFDSHAVYRSNLDGTEIQTFVPGMENPGSLAIDPFNRNLYFVEGAAQKIWRIGLNGSNLTQIYQGPGLSFAGSGLAFVPEPSAMLGLGFGVVLLARRVRKP